MEIALNVLLTSTLLSLVIWISKTNPVLGGFIVSLPLSTLIVLAISKIQSDNPGNTFILAKSIFIAVPASLLFFVPFLLAEKMKFSFWMSYGLGLVLLSLSYVIHKWAMANWFK